MSKPRKEHEDQVGCLTNLIVALIFIFIFPIMWVAKKFDTGGPNAGVGSFILASLIVLVTVGTIATGCAVALGWLVFH